MAQPEGCRYELVAGQVVAMAPERASHNEGKLEGVVALRQAIRAAGLPCRADTDGMAVRIDADTVYEPDALVRCGERLGPNVVEVVDPVILVEVISPSTHEIDTTRKLGDYFRVPSVRHYLIVNTSRRTVVHHDGGSRTGSIPDGARRRGFPGAGPARHRADRRFAVPRPGYAGACRNGRALWLVAACAFAAPASAALSGREVRCLALVAYTEAAVDGVPGMTAVIRVVRNRMADPRFPDDACAVIAQVAQFQPIAQSNVLQKVARDPEGYTSRRCWACARHSPASSWRRRTGWRERHRRSPTRPAAPSIS